MSARNYMNFNGRRELIVNLAFLARNDFKYQKILFTWVL